jgi:hypothetical protein
MYTKCGASLNSKYLDFKREWWGVGGGGCGCGGDKSFISDEKQVPAVQCSVQLEIRSSFVQTGNAAFELYMKLNFTFQRKMKLARFSIEK